MGAFVERFVTSWKRDGQCRPDPILALNDPWHDSAFFFQDHDGAVHVEVERFTRRKHDFVNPMLAFCELYPEKVRAFSRVVIHEGGPVSKYLRLLVKSKAAGARRWKDLSAPPLGEPWLVETEGTPTARQDSPAVRAFLEHLLSPEVTIFFAGHHASHSAHSYYSSNHAAALVITLDGGGLDFDASCRTGVLDETAVDDPRYARVQIYGSAYRGTGNSLELVQQFRDFSIGTMWYRAVVQVLGCKEGEEGTVMAMAAYGHPERFSRFFQDPSADLPQDYVLDGQQRLAAERWRAGLSAAVVTEQDRFDVAAALQEVTEQRIRAHIGALLQPDDQFLCLAGGVFLNCLATGKIRDWFPQLQGVYIPPAPYDGGLPVGSAQLVQHQLLGHAERLGAMVDNDFALGPSYSRSAIVAAVHAAGFSLQEVNDEDVFVRLADGRIGALFQGPAESGRRALGHRSIVAHPGIEGLRERLNNVIKHRQAFRPFAPMVLAEHVGDWFQCPAGFASPYMSFAVVAHPHRRDQIRNVLHVDWTARVQTVHRERTERLHRLLSGWHRHSGIPILLNTSFNDQEPIVQTPADAVQTFLRTPIDFLYFADHGLLVQRK
jgi:carbamoyltransferase